MDKRKQVILHLKDNKYVSIVQDRNDTCEIAIITSEGGVDYSHFEHGVKRYLNTQELAMELLKLNLDNCY